VCRVTDIPPRDDDAYCVTDLPLSPHHKRPSRDRRAASRRVLARDDARRRRRSRRRVRIRSPFLASRRIMTHTPSRFGGVGRARPGARRGAAAAAAAAAASAATSSTSSW
jgi:hypothetical protein